MCKRILRPSQVAHQLGFHVSTIRRWFNAKKVDGVRLPAGQILIFQTSVERFLDMRY